MFYVLEKFLRETINGLERVDRWKPYVESGSTPENDLQHSLSTVFLTIIVLELLEEEPPDIGYSQYEVLACAALHDLGEIGVGDTIYRKKNTSSVHRELESFRRQISNMPDKLHARMQELYMVQYGRESGVSDYVRINNDSKEGSRMVFDFIERTGYVLYAIGEYKKSVKNVALLVHVMRNQIEHIKRLLVTLPAGKRIFTENLMEWMEIILYENRNIHFEK